MGARTRGFANNVLTSGKLDATDGLTGNLASTNFANATVTNIEELPPAVGSTISSVAGNPAAPVAEGKIWYNTSTDSFNIAPVLEAWSSGAPLITAKARYTQGGAGTQTAALAIGGWISSSTTQTEEYNGSGWSQGGALGTARYGLYTAGTQTAAFAATGKTPPVTTATEEYDGSTWTAGGSVATERFLGGSSGTLTAGLIHGGRNSANTANLNNTEEYDGTSWTAGGNLNAARNTPFSSGSQTAALAAGGSGVSTGNTAVGEHYDGSAWTTVNSMNTERRSGAPSISGTQTSSLAFGGFTTTMVTNTESYDGTNWSNSPTSLGTARYGLGGAGTGNAALAFGGQNNVGTQYTNTEEFNKSANVITAGAWASGGNLGTGRYYLGGASNAPLTTALVWGGTVGPTFTNTSNTETYDGTSWTEQNNLNTGRTRMAGFGTQTAAVSAAGRIMGGSDVVNNVEEYNGTSWTNVTAYPVSTRANDGSGTESAGLSTGGTPGTGFITTTNEYDGSSWTAGGALNSARGYASGCFGVQTAIGHAGGREGSPSVATTHYEEYDGSSWTTEASLVSSTSNVHGFGTTSSATIGNADNSGSPAQQWDGTAWITAPSMSTVREYYSGGGTSGSSGLGAGGYQPGFYTATEEFTGETSALNVESLTTS